VVAPADRLLEDRVSREPVFAGRLLFTDDKVCVSEVPKSWPVGAAGSAEAATDVAEGAVLAD
jgi:hypothetical protein